ncbi:MAG: HAD family phosphatase [Acidimicrobiales bacterium]|jgi:HAD superfamily hydrolase (TIGR01509 family)
MSTAVRAVVFDCDGVLVDSEKAWFVGIVEVFQRRGIQELVTGPASSLYGASVGDVVSVLERELGEPLDTEAVTKEVFDAILAAIADGVVAMDGAVELLETIRGSRPLAVASNGSRETVEASLKAASIPFVFDAIVAVEPPLRPKPAPDVYLHACELLGVDPTDAIAVEDSLPGAKAARAAGMTVVGLGSADGLNKTADQVVANLGDQGLRDLLGLGPLL